MNPLAEPRTICRVCRHTELIPILNLGTQFISNFVDSPQEDQPKAPLEVVLCDPASGGCSLLQLRHTTPADLLYRHYWYRSVVNRTMQVALRDIAESAESLVALDPGDVVLDIGCNDGTLLRTFSNPDIKRVGFEPARNLIEDAEVETTRIFNAFFNAADFVEEFGGGGAKVITSIAMFYDLDEPNEFVGDIKACLDRDGVWIIQMAYLPTMLEHNMFDNICHEHLEYYSLGSLEHLLQRHDLEVFDVLLNDVNGGSYRVYARHSTSRREGNGFARARVNALRAMEHNLHLEEETVYKDFASRVLEICSDLRNFIEWEREQGKKVYAYGASTKGNTMLQLAGLDHTLIDAAAERNPDKWGRVTVGTAIPIISEEQARADRPDYFLVLPWHFLREFRDRESEFLERGGQFLVPLPEPRLIGAYGSRPLPKVTSDLSHAT
ncbi:MAG: class I SAM-dependent methyltransferase [Actinomycetota bacterium]